jgi:hypothetical protein
MSKKKKAKKKAKEDALWDLMLVNAQIARRKIAIFEEQLKPIEDQNETKIKFLTISLGFWMREYNEIMGKA